MARKKNKYTPLQFKEDCKHLLDIAGNSLNYLNKDVNNYRMTFGDEELGLFCDVYLSTRTVIVRTKYNTPVYYRKQSWSQIERIFNNIFNHW